MYCDNCHKENPDNFAVCVYCGASMVPQIGAKSLKSRNSLRSLLTPVRVFTVLFILCVISSAIALAYIKSSEEHPETVSGAYALAISNNDTDAYYALYDSEYRAFMIDNYYYSQKAMKSELESELSQMREFYSAKCGSEYQISCETTVIGYADKEALSDINSRLVSEFEYKNTVSNAAVLRLNLTVEGSQDKYLTVIDDFVCIKINGVWYKTEEVTRENVLTTD